MRVTVVPATGQVGGPALFMFGDNVHQAPALSAVQIAEAPLARSA